MISQYREDNELIISDPSQDSQGKRALWLPVWMFQEDLSGGSCSPKGRLELYFWLVGGAQGFNRYFADRVPMCWFIEGLRYCSRFLI